MLIRYAKTIPVIYLAATGTMTAVISESLDTMVSRAMSAHTRQPQNQSHWPELCSFTWRDCQSTPTSQESLLLRLVKILYGPASRRQDPYTSILKKWARRMTYLSCFRSLLQMNENSWISSLLVLTSSTRRFPAAEILLRLGAESFFYSWLRLPSLYCPSKFSLDHASHE